MGVRVLPLTSLAKVTKGWIIHCRYTAIVLEACILMIKVAQWHTAETQSEEGVSVKVVSGPLRSLADGIISDRDGREGELR